MAIYSHPKKEDIKLTNILSALSDKNRLKIVKILYDNKDGLNCSMAIKPFANIPKSTLSSHFRILRESGLIHTQKSGIENLNTLRFAEIEEKFPNLLLTIFNSFDFDN